MEPAQQYSAFLPQVMEIQKNLLALADRPADLVRYLPGELRQITGARCTILVGCPDGMASGRHILGISQDPESQQVDESQIKALIDLLCCQDKPTLWRPDDDSAAAPILRSLGFGLSHGIPLVSREVRVGGLFLLGLPVERDLTSIRETLRQLVSIVALALYNAFLFEGQEKLIAERTRQLEEINAALRKSQEKLQAFFNSNLFGTATGDIYGNIFDANDEYLRLVGYSRQDLEAGRLRWDELTPPEYMPLDEKAIAEAREHGACTPFEKQYIRRDGSRVWVLVGFILFGENREKSASFALNISGRKQETERLQAILDNIPVMIDHFDSAGKFIWANQYWEKTLGWPLGEALDRGNILEEIYPDPSLRRSVVEHIQHTSGAWKDSQIRARDGRILDTTWAEVRLSDGSIYGIGQDVTERKRAEDELRESEKRYRLISEHSADVIWTLDLATWRFTYVSPSVYKLRGFTPEEVMAQPVSAVMSADSYHYVVENMPVRLAAFAAGDESKRSMTTIIQQPRRDGSMVTTEVATTLVTDESGQAVELLGVSRDISERLRLEADRRALEERFRRLAENAQDIIYRYRVFPDKGFEYISPAITAIIGYTPEEMYASPELGTQLLFPEDQQQLEDLIDQGANRPVALRWKRKDGKLIWIEMRFTVIMDEVGRLVAFEGIARDVTERVQRQRELEAMVTLSAALRTAPDQASLVATILGQVYRMLEADGCALSLKEPNSEYAKTVLANGRIAHITGVRIPADKGVSGYAMQTGQLYLTQNFANDPHAYMPEMLGELQSVACAPLISQGVTIGVLMIARMTEIDSHEARMLTAIADIAANALQRTSLYESATRHARQMAAVSEIGRALSETLDLSNIFRLLDRYLYELLPDISRVSVSFYNAAKQQFTCVFTSVDGKAIDCSQLAPTPLAPPGRGTQSQVIYTRKTLIVNNLFKRQKTGALGRPPAGDNGEEPHSGLYAPMLTHKAIIGVIHVQSMTPNRFTEEDAELIATVANTSAVAIENTRLLADLQRSNQDLVRAYDTTLAGWSRALDLRDKETEGHTQRVADWAVKLAIRLGIGGEELVNVQRGALLHDIGKMGVPDEILRKPGKFTPKEWKIMQQHARYAYDLLRPIEYLRGALDIPYCHHEKWDGSGYPRGLCGVQIPLAARVFTVIDVWDALCNERPYRPAWSPQDALEYIHEQSGKHFDPNVVEAFLKMVGT